MRYKEKIKIISSFKVFDVKDIKIWCIKYQGHKARAKTMQRPSELTFRDYLTKAHKAGITKPDQIGRETGKYALVRYVDTDNYTNDNCDFLSTTQIDRYKVAMHNRSLTITPELKKMIADRNSRNYVLKDPNNNIHYVRNLMQFCLQHKLDNGAMFKVVKGYRQHHKNWTGHYQ